MAGAFPQGSARGGNAQKTLPAPTPAPAQAPQDSAMSRVAGRANAALKRFDASKLAMKQTGEALLHTGETMGSLFISSMAEGYFGHDKLKVGGLDLRAPIGLATQAFGFYSIMTGERSGEHALAVGNGVTGSYLASVARDAGQALRDRKSQPAPGQAQTQAAPAGTAFRGEEPMVYIPPEPEVIDMMPSPTYQGPLQLPPGPNPYPVPYQAPQMAPQFQPNPPYYAHPGQVPQYTNVYPGAPSWQGNMVPVEPVQMGAVSPGYPQGQPRQVASPGWNVGPDGQIRAAGPVTYAPAGPLPRGMVPGPVPAPGLMPEPTPRVAGTSREVMLTQEEMLEAGFVPPGPHSAVGMAEAMEGAYQRHPRMMLVPESDLMEGVYQRPVPRMMMTPEAPTVEGQPLTRHPRMMVTPEAPTMEGPQRPNHLRMMMTPEAPVEAPFEGRRMVLTPAARAQAEATAQSIHQRRQSMAQAYQASQAAPSSPVQPTMQEPALDPSAQVAGNEEDFGGPRERQERRSRRQAALRQLGRGRLETTGQRLEVRQEEDSGFEGGYEAV